MIPASRTRGEPVRPRRSRPPVLPVCIALLVCVGSPDLAWSQQKSSDGVEQSDSPSETDGDIESLPKEEKKELLELVKSARRDYSAGNFREVVPTMKRAYELFPDPEFLYRIGLSYERAGDSKEALEYYRRYLEEKPQSKKRGRIEKTIERLETRLRKAERGEASGEASKGATATPPDEKGTKEQTEKRPPPGSTRSNDTLSTVLFVSGGVFAASAGTFGYLNLQQRSDVRAIASESRSRTREGSGYDTAVRKQNLYAGLTYGSAALAAGALTWGILRLASRPSETRRTSLEPSLPGLRVLLGPNQIDVRGRF